MRRTSRFRASRLLRLRAAITEARGAKKVANAVTSIPPGARARDTISQRLILPKVMELRGLGLGPRKIAKALNKASILHPRSNRPWLFNQIQGLLRTAKRRCVLEASSA